MGHSGVVTDTKLAQVLRVMKGFRLRDVDPRSTPGFAGGKGEGKRALASGMPRLGEWQERLHAAGAGGSARSVLLVLQGMDTSGKGGITRHVVGAVDVAGVRYAAFKKPTQEELAHDFLWRVRRALPGGGVLGVFDRSHYEDVLVVRVHGFVPPPVWGARYDLINDFEREVVGAGTAIVKVMLHISAQEQKARLAARLQRADKYWKYNPGDLVERALWPAYQEAYEAALTRCSTPGAPWHVVPADRKWYARWAVQQLLLDALEDINPQYPHATFDVAAERVRLAQSPDVPPPQGAPG
jgi:PPK2 family polyphosphate:nucleotide phosphotransferase